MRMFRGLSRRRRVKYGSQLGPYGMNSATRYPFRARSDFSGSRTPRSIWNSNGLRCSRLRSIARKRQGFIDSIAVSPDGSLVAIAVEDERPRRCVELWAGDP